MSNPSEPSLDLMNPDVPTAPHSASEIAAILAWIRDDAFQLPRAGEELSGSLAELALSIGGHQIIGMAEATHGSSEFFTVRFQLLRHLICSHGFRALAIEASESATARLNEYVTGGAGDPRSLLTDLGMVMWDVEEFCDMVAWLRWHNMSVGTDDAVHLFGVDVWNTRFSRKRISAHLNRILPGMQKSVETAFGSIEAAEQSGMMRAHEHVDASTLQSLIDLRDALERSRRSDPQNKEIAGSLRDFEVVIQLAKTLIGSESTHKDASAPTVGLDNFRRSLFMAENLRHAVESRKCALKVVVWAHVFHLSVGFAPSPGERKPNMGWALRRHFGAQYHALAFETAQGCYLARQVLRGDQLGELIEPTIDAPPRNSVAWYLSNACSGDYYLTLRAPAALQAARRWLREPIDMHALSWCYAGQPGLYATSLERAFDAVLFLQTTSPTQPTINARRSVMADGPHW